MGGGLRFVAMSTMSVERVEVCGHVYDECGEG